MVTGKNLGTMQVFTGRMENMDGDVSTQRFLPPKAKDDGGEPIWSDGLAHLWVEANKTWCFSHLMSESINFRVRAHGRSCDHSSILSGVGWVGFVRSTRATVTRVIPARAAA